MNQAHWHLMLVHIPVVLMPCALALAVLALWRSNVTLRTTAFSIFLIAGLVAVPAYLLGEGAEEQVEDIAGVSEDNIESHEEAAETALWLTVTLSVFSALGLLAGSRKPALVVPLSMLVVVLGAVTSASLAYTAQQGGRIRHPEAFDQISTQTHAGEPR